MDKGAEAIVQSYWKSFLYSSALITIAIGLAACGTTTTTNTGTSGAVDPNETAAKVNGTVIRMEDVDRAVSQQAQGQAGKLSDIERAGARLQVLQGLIEQEVMFQKAEKESLAPSDEDINAEVNKRKIESRLSAEEFNRQMEAAGMNDKSFRDAIKKDLAIKKLIDKVTSRIETPTDAEIEGFFRSNPEMFVKKRGVRLAAIVVDPADGGQGDVTRNATEADQRLKEIMEKVSQPASDFAALAREYSEDGSKLQGGDLGYLSEVDLKTNYPDLAEGFMSPTFTAGKITNPIRIQGKAYIFKLQERIEQDETLTLESMNVRPQINQLLVENRKQLLAASYQAIAMNEAKIENFLAQKVVSFPNELSGARPAGAMNSNSGATSNTAANMSTANSTGSAGTSTTPTSANASRTANNNRPANANR